MILLALSAAFVGLVHSLAPGHWLPVVLMTQARKWPARTAALGALAAAAGHIFLSVILGIVGVEISTHVLASYEDRIEKFSGLALAVFGLAYAAFAYFRHSSCHGHTHHGPDPGGKKWPFLFLLSLGFSPCVAALPIFLAASPYGVLGVSLVLASFSLGVIAALVGATLLVSFGLLKLDHPILEHYGDVITGAGVSLAGLALFLL